MSDNTSPEILQNPVSFTGSAKRVWPLGRRVHRWPGAGLAWTGVILLLVLAWVGVLTWYALLCVPLFLGWVPWTIWTLNRRHHIHDVGRAAMAAGFSAAVQNYGDQS